MPSHFEDVFYSEKKRKPSLVISVEVEAIFALKN